MVRSEISHKHGQISNVNRNRWIWVEFEEKLAWVSSNLKIKFVQIDNEIRKHRKRRIALSKRKKGCRERKVIGKWGKIVGENKFVDNLLDSS